MSIFQGIVEHDGFMTFLSLFGIVVITARFVPPMILTGFIIVLPFLLLLNLLQSKDVIKVQHHTWLPYVMALIFMIGLTLDYVGVLYVTPLLEKPVLYTAPPPLLTTESVTTYIFGNIEIVFLLVIVSLTLIRFTGRRKR